MSYQTKKKFKFGLFRGQSLEAEADLFIYFFIKPFYILFIALCIPWKTRT